MRLIGLKNHDLISEYQPNQPNQCSIELCQRMKPSSG